jgi:hypothetical protein
MDGTRNTRLPTAQVLRMGEKTTNRLNETGPQADGLMRGSRNVAPAPDASAAFVPMQLLELTWRADHDAMQAGGGPVSPS